MLRLPPFHFRVAKTLDEAAGILVGEGVAEHEDNVRLVAGGTDLWPNMKRRHQKARTVVSLMGDGGFGMTSSELGTAVQHDIRTVCVVMNNGCWGAEKAYQRDFFGGRYIGADIPNPPYDDLARLWGAAGFRADRAEDVEGALRAALACGRPAVVDVRVDPNALYSFRRDSFKHRAQS